ncbi:MULTISPECIES: murein L,D-transpeptidase [Pseudomonas]|uniref:L,D-transpeptidase family protein n=1 Tax=Pseudomonas fluorescens TaxID=294 RepID=A0ACD4XL30_PSEFL|nr:MULTISPECIES: L,D-transpeptidase family protein [Pseudomonas]MBZ6456249.1 L,D-transpeptidase family protein [Pseudomonas fluorescens group sp.]MBZ6460560.1 L,D-transpeptidase family protein [Pseudomonas fluorescens group sp.]MBZ6466202.1 L,D-transpeptidase family protein [Pseudomonas fluorescens group sp.]WQD69913.1 L,D-transpeptidase family protein [Pseudomonas marginalis]SFU47364.1 Murein L,D-transpeptidase YcbB/YkuD [Pseudomonas sp. OV546]
MFKKHACYLSICLLVAPLVATADEPLPVAPPALVNTAPVQQALAQLPSVCPSLAPQIDGAAQARLQAFYQQQGDEPLWSADERRQALQTQLLMLADDGLDPTHYSLPALDATTNVLCSDIGTSQHYLQALWDLHYGRLQQSRFEPLWHSQPPTRDPNTEVLAFAAAGLQDMAQAFDQARPSADLYRSLRNAYATVRQQPLPHWDPVGSGPLLRPGMEDPRVPELARRLISGGYLATASSGKQYHDELVKAVKAFQLSHSLQADGVIGAGTVAELNISPAIRREQLRINLERFRWLAQDLEPEGVLVNVAAAQLSVYQSGIPVWQTRLQVGRAERQTPLLKSRITRLTLNPTWTIPPTIMREDKLPAIRLNPEYLRQQNLQVLDAEGHPLAPEQIDWARPGNILLRQEAGPRNPLGKIVMRFPNPYSVYLHDTPSQPLFTKGPRAFSSGCVRVEQPLLLRDLLVSPAERARTDELLATGVTHEFRLATPVPVLLGYWTVEVDRQGGLVYAPDIYARDLVLMKAMGSLL